MCADTSNSVNNVNTNNSNSNSLSKLMDLFVDAYSSSIQFYLRLNRSFLDALFVPFMDAREEIVEIRKGRQEGANHDPLFIYKQEYEYYRKLEKIIMAKIREKFDGNIREEGFVRSLSEFIDSSSMLAKAAGYGYIYQNTSNFNSFWNNTIIEPIRDKAFRTPSHKIYSERKYSLFHYDGLGGRGGEEQQNQKQRQLNENNSSNNRKSEASTVITTPLLIIYAFINRHYILDLLPDSSIVRNLQRQGFDIFAADWGTPSTYDKELTIGHYVNNYLANAIDYIRTHTGSEKVSLLGYCWGGDLALMLAALHPEKIKNVVTLATPGDFSIDNNLLALWTRAINPDTLIDTFGNVPSAFINSAFLLRSPIDYLHKYPHFFFERIEPIDLESIIEFFATEMWLYDSPPVIGEIYRQFVEDCYQKNLLIKNQMKLSDRLGEDGEPVDLGKIKVPFLNVIASKDDLVAPESSKALNNVIGSSDKTLIEFNSGHVGACIGSRAHRELWPKVGSWLKERSL